MSIPFSKYVRITSGVGGSVGVQTRALIGRLISSDPRLDPASVYEFTSAADVGTFFGTSSPEYARASFYFSYVSPAISSPRRISFSRYAPAGAAAGVWGGKFLSTLTALQGATAGVLTFVFNGNPVSVNAINLATAASLSDVAAKLTTALNANADPHLTTATVTYDAVNAVFNFSAGLIDGATVSVASAGAGANDLRTALSWSTGLNARYTSGVIAQSATDALTASINASNNFGSFAFIPTLSLADVTAIATMNAGLNVMFQYCAGVTNTADAQVWSAALIGLQGTGLTLSPLSTEFPELVPMIQLAATDYSRVNATVNYMFKQFNLTPSVATGALSDQLDALRVNYYGQTQTAGQSLSFYQRGLLMGSTASAPVDMNVYANEQWLKDSVGTRLMGLLLGTGRVPANAAGRGQILAVVQGSIDDAINNGTISIGKTLTTAQQLFVTQQSGDPLAWHQVQTAGYWVDAQIVPFTGPSGTQEYKAVYTLIYSKDDAIRSIEGTHNLV